MSRSVLFRGGIPIVGRGPNEVLQRSTEYLREVPYVPARPGRPRADNGKIFVVTRGLEVLGVYESIWDATSDYNREYETGAIQIVECEP